MTFTAHIYKLCCLDVTITDIYVGSCKSMTHRKYGHKQACTKPDDKNHNLRVYQFIRENGGWNNWSMVELKEWQCESKAEMGKVENEHMISHHATLNSRVAPDGRPRSEVQKAYRGLHKVEIAATKHQWEVDNREAICQSKKGYYQEHKAEILANRNVYQEHNKEAIAERGKEYRERNAESISKRRKEYREQNKNSINLKKSIQTQCPCGNTYTNGHASRHMITARHIAYENSLQTEPAESPHQAEPTQSSDPARSPSTEQTISASQ